MSEEPPKKKKYTIDIIKQKRKVDKKVIKGTQEFAKKRKMIFGALKQGPKTIPEIARETGLSLKEVTWYLMSLRKYGSILETGETTDDGYYKYKLTGV